MLALVLIVGSTVTVLLLRQRSSETYRCPTCAELHVGRYHRLHCFVRDRREQRTPLAGKAGLGELVQAAKANAVLAETTRSAANGGSMSILPGFLAQRAVKETASAFRRHLHLAS